MLKIGLKKNPKKDFPCVVVNGRIDKESFAFHMENGLHQAHLYNPKVAGVIMACRVEDLERHFTGLDLPYEVEWSGYFYEVGVRLFSWQPDQDRKLKQDRKIIFELRPDGEKWSKPYSIAEYADALEQTVKKRAKKSIRYYEDDEFLSNGFGIQCRMKSGNPILSGEIDRCAQVLKSVLDEAEKLLAAKARNNSITTFFSFPPAVRTACEQYLLYFVQFLEDLGIKAEAELKEDAQRVLFSVTPADGASALEQIRQALEVYLKLPGMPDFDSTAGQHQNLAVQQLHANVLHLQSQLILAKAALQAKDATIEALQFSNFQYRQHLLSDEKPKEQTEPLIGDTVHVTKIEGKGVKVDLPLILKRLKRVFGVGGKKIE